MDKNKGVALITGASGGIGIEFAKQLAASGYDIILVSRNREKLEKVKNDLESRHEVKAFVLPCDLSEPGSACRLFENYKKTKLPKIDVLINNAGSGLAGKSLNQSIEEVEGLLILNIVSLTDICILFGKDMSENGGGRILNIGSLAARNAVPYFSAYSASKAYVLGYSIALARELKQTGVSVTCLLPGFVRTNFDANAKITSEKYKKMTSRAGMMPDKVAKIGLRALFKNKMVCTAGLANKLTGFFSQFIPRTISSGIMKMYLDNFFGN